MRMFRAGVGGPYDAVDGKVGFRLDGWDYWMTPARREDFDKISLEHAEVRGWPLLYLVMEGGMFVWPKPAVDMQMIVEAAV